VTERKPEREVVGDVYMLLCVYVSMPLCVYASMCDQETRPGDRQVRHTQMCRRITNDTNQGKQTCVERAHRCVDASSMTRIKGPVGEDVGDLVFVYLIPAAKGVVHSAHHLNPCV